MQPLRLDDVAIGIDLLLPRLSADPVEHPAENRPQKRAVDKVHREALLPEPQQQSVGEELLRRWRDVDGHDDAVDADSGVPFGDVHVGREDVLGEPEHEAGPRGPFRVLSGIPRHKHAENRQKGGHDLSTPAVVVDELLEGHFIGQVAQEHPVHALHLEGLWSRCQQEASLHFGRPAERRPTGILGIILVEVEHHANVDQHPVPELDIHGGKEQDVDQHRALEQGQQRPLVVIVGHVPGGPRAEEVLEQPQHFLPERVLQIRRGVSAPPAIGAVGHGKRSALRHHPRDHHGDRGREDEAGRPTEGAPGDGREGRRRVAGPGELEGLEGADIAREEAEDGHPDAALPGDPEKRPLQDAGRGVLTVARGEEVVVPGASQVGEHDQDGGNAS